MNAFVSVGIGFQYVVLLLVLGLDVVTAFLQVVFLFLGDFLGLLLVLFLTEYSLTG